MSVRASEMLANFPEGSLCSKASDCESDQLGANPSPRTFLGT